MASNFSGMTLLRVKSCKKKKGLIVIVWKQIVTLVKFYLNLMS